MAKMPGKWMREECRRHGSRCIDPVVGHYPSWRELRSGWKRKLRKDLLDY